MSLSIAQGVAVSFPAIVAEKNQPANQWEESALLREMERQGFIMRKSLGPTIEAPLDYKANPAAAFMLTDMTPLSMTKTEVITSASYSVAELSAPMVWSKKDEVQNPTENQKVALVKSIITNGLSSHDDLIEQALFPTSTNGFLGMLTFMSDAGTGSAGGIDAGTETWWANKTATYVDDTDIEAAFTSLYNACAKGSGSKLQPTLLVSDGATQAIFEGTQQALQRWNDATEANAGFKMLSFKNARYVFSQYGGSRVFFINPKNLMLTVSKEYFRDRGDVQEIPNQNAFISKIYSALQLITNNRSRLGVCHT